MKQMLVDDDLLFLPEEIITNILKRLPVKSLIRFQCVCKHWNNLIKTPSFIQDHLHHSAHHNPSLLIGQDNRNGPLCLCLLNCKMQFCEFENAPLLGSLVGVCLIGSCNGLLCLADRQSPAPLLWNPATREVRQVPITFDDFLGDCYFGFGFSPIINDYKIVRFLGIGMVRRVEAYSLSTSSWRNIQFDNIKDVFIISDGSVTVNGVMFWNGLKRGVDRDDASVIVSFDLAMEVFTVTPSPAFFRHSGARLAVYEDKLAIISHPKIENSEYSSIYFGVMEEGGIGSSGERWSLSKKYIHKSTRLRFYAAWTIWRNQIVYIDFGMCRLFRETKRTIENVKPKLYLIDVTTNECKWLAIPRQEHNFSVSVLNYVESLVPIGNLQH